MLKYQHCNFAVFFEGGIALGDMKDREHNTLSGDGLDEELSQIRDAFQQELEEATKRAEQEAEKNAQSGKEEAPPALPTSPVRAEGEAANAAVSAGEQKADWKVIVLAVIVAFVALYGAADFFIGVSPLPGCYTLRSMFAQESLTLRSTLIMTRARIQRPRRRSAW